ncbi:MAG: HDIG domain-containing protein [Bacteroidota bacterium]|nr:HDIG domain-containing protein [Bacteroidota bacterium]
MAGLFGFLRDKHALWYKAFLFFASVALIVGMLPKRGQFKYEFEQLNGKPWNYDNLIAPFDFPIYKSVEEFESEKSAALKNARSYFTYNDELLKKKIRLFDTLDQKESKQLYDAGKSILDSISKRGIIENHDVIQDKEEDFSIYVVREGVAEEQELSHFFTLSTADKFIVESVERCGIKNKPALVELLESNLVQTIFYDDTLTKKSLTQELGNILPAKDKIVKGQIIISKGELVSKEKFEILNSFRKEVDKTIVSTSDYAFLLIGQFIAALLCMSMIFLFLAFFRKNIFAQNAHVTFIVLVTLLFVFIAQRVSVSEKLHLFIIPFTIAPIMIRAFFDTRTALFTHLNIVLLASFFAAERFEFFFIETLAGIGAIFSIANMTRRSQLIVSALIVMIIYMLSHTALTFILESKSNDIALNDYAVYGASALMILIAYPMIFVFEKMFGFVSDFTLLELSDSNSLLLRELATKAPGTFQHTLQVASLAEEAIQKVGGNPLLIRTGAMYHDIGKMENPRYFTENQVGGSNPHEELGYEESASLIIGHVIKGVEMARKNRIPEQVIDFIRTHHGTSLTRYFYKMSINDFGNSQTDESKFRYSGPVPFSKETAVLMMADSIEASSRSLKNYDAVSIDELVERIINSQIEENQFVNSDITFRDITTIKKIFKKRLMNIYHVRIEYPR